MPQFHLSWLGRLLQLYREDVILNTQIPNFTYSYFMWASEIEHIRVSAAQRRRGERDIL